jgi:threonine synthase
MRQSRGTDGGLYLPLRFPKLSDDDLRKLREMLFNHRIAFFLNMFFSTKISGWDVDFSVGRYPVRLSDLSHRIILGEFWHNLQWNYKYLEKKLAELVNCDNTDAESWSAIGIRMAILAAAVLDRDESEHDPIDVAAAFGDFTVETSAWYLRKMGLPIGNVVCCCAEDNQLWEFVCLGQMKPDAAFPANLERLISDCGGLREVEQYRSGCAAGTHYVASEEMLEKIRKCLYVSVVSSDRLEAAVPNVFRTYDYILQSESALAYCGLMDYRTKTGITRPALVMCDYSPVCEAERISDWMNLSKDEFLKLV